MDTLTLTYILTSAFLLIAIDVNKTLVYQIYRESVTTKPKLSLIIATKKEEANINSLIDSPDQLKYQKENF